MFELGVCYRNITRADRAAADGLAALGSATVHEAMGRVGLLKPYMRPIYPGKQVSGTAITVLLQPGDNWMLHVAAEQIQPGDIVIAAVTALVLGVAAHLPAVIYVAMAVWGLSFGGAATLLQTALADTAGSGADVALSMNVVAWNGAIAAAGVAGGTLLETWGVAAFPWAMAGLILLAFAIAWSAREHGFRPGRRSGGAPVAGH